MLPGSRDVVTLGAGGAQKKTLRFPRVLKGPKSTKGLRVKRLELGIDGDEKPWYDCMRVSEFQELVQQLEERRGPESEYKSAIERPKSPEKKARRGAVVLDSQKFTEFKGEKISEALAGCPPPLPPPLVLNGHAASLTPY